MGEKVTRETRKLKKDRCPYDWYWDDKSKKCKSIPIFSTHELVANGCKWEIRRKK